jgi:hypothetical protein
MSNYDPQAKSDTSSNMPDFLKTVSSSASNAAQSLSDTVSGTASSVKQSLSEFGSNASVDGSSDFLNSNSIVAKFAFIILVLIVFLFLANLGILLIGYFMQPASSPFLLKGTSSGASELTISQDPKNKDGVTLLRSNNRNTGIEFTWCTWLYFLDINTTTNDATRYKHIFNKGDANWDGTGAASVNNAPGLYLDTKYTSTGSPGASSPGALSAQTSPQTAVLHFIMNTVSNTNPIQTLDVSNVPIKKWFHCAVRMQNTTMDVYINGVVTGRLILNDVPKQNYDDVHICKNGGFNGQIADVQYYDRALSVFEINNMVVWGRNTNASSATGTSDGTGFPYYLSNVWYSSKF